MKNLICFLILLIFSGCASTAPVFEKYEIADFEKRLIKVNPVLNKTGNKEYDKQIAALTGKVIDYIEKSGKYKVIDLNKSKTKELKVPDCMISLSVTKITFYEECLFGLIAWINTPTVEVDMDLRITDIDTSEILSTASVTQKAWEDEWVALFVFKIGKKKTKEQLEPIALNYALKAIVDKM